MYKITINGFTLHDDTTDRTDDKVTAATLTKEENNAGVLSYTVPPTHKYYDGFGKPHIGNYIAVYENRRVAVSSDPDANRWEDILIWKGRPISWSEDFVGNINVECEGDMARLNDVVYPGQESFSGTLYSAFSAVMDYYNATSDYEIRYDCSILDNTKTVNMSLEEGAVLDVLTSIVNSSESTYYLTYELFFGELTLCVTGTTLNFADGYQHQEITVDKNLIDLTKQIDYSEFATAIIPRDSNGNGVESVNDNSMVVIDSLSHSIYGHIEKIVTFDEPSVQNNPSALLAAAKKWFSSANNTRGEIEVTALDLSVVQNYNPSYANDLYRPFALRQGIWFNGSDTAEPVQMVINRMELDLINLANSRYSLSMSDNPSVKPVSTLSLVSEDSAETFAEPRATSDEAAGYIGKKSDISYMLSKANMDKSKTYDYGNGITCRVAADYDIWLYGQPTGGYGASLGCVYGAAAWLLDGNALYPELGGGVQGASYIIPGAFYRGPTCDPGAAVVYVYNGWVSDVIKMPDADTVNSVIQTAMGESWSFTNGTPYVANVSYDFKYENYKDTYSPFIQIGYDINISDGSTSRTYMIGINGEANQVTKISNAFTNILTGERISNTNNGLPRHDTSFSAYSLTAISKPDADSVSKFEKWRTTVMDPGNKGYKVWSVQGAGIPKTPPGGITDLMKKSYAGGYYYAVNPPSVSDTKIQKQIIDKAGKYDYMWASGGVGIDIWDVPPAASASSYSGLRYGTNVAGRAWKAAADADNGIIGIGDANHLEDATGSFKGTLNNTTGVHAGTVLTPNANSVNSSNISVLTGGFDRDGVTIYEDGAAKCFVKISHTEDGVPVLELSSYGGIILYGDYISVSRTHKSVNATSEANINNADYTNTAASSYVEPPQKGATGTISVGGTPLNFINGLLVEDGGTS